MQYLTEKDGALVFRRRHELLEIRPWGNGLRIRATENRAFTGRDWALSEPAAADGRIELFSDYAEVSNGKIKAVITEYGKMRFLNQDGKELLKEYYRSWDYGTKGWKDLDQITMVRMTGRQYRNVGGDNYELHLRFEADDQERIYGMGQYQQPYLNLKGCTLDMEQKNTQASVPFLVSDKGYGLLWNNPAVGQAAFGRNRTEFSAQSSKQIDYWITAGDTPAEIVESYTAVTGRVPMMPDFAMGFWQCKLRYQTQEELLSIAREYKKRGLPISVIVVDFFHWPLQGDWKFDPTYWPDPDAMIAQLKEMGIELMVSIWPTVDKRNPRYREMLEKGLLIRTDRGVRVAMEFQGSTVHYDATNPAARDYVWGIAKENYYDKGVRIFWLDEAEPEYTAYDFDNYRYYLGPNTKVGNSYPLFYAKTFFDGMQAQGQENIINLLRCAWAGSQKYGALVWSGDIHSSFESFRNQFAAGLNMGIAGIPWWTTDIGGFHGGDPTDPAFQELLARWFQYGAFCPVMRLHGDRYPTQPQQGTTGGATCLSGAPNEVWCFGEEDYEICKKYMFLRERLRPYIKEQMAAAHEKGTPVMRPLFYDFPADSAAWACEDAYLFGPSLLVAPVMEAGQRRRSVYLPAGAQWTHVWSGETYEGGQTVTVAAPLEEIPVFTREKDLLPLFAEKK